MSTGDSRLVANLTSEHALLLVMLLISTYMVVEAFTFSSEVAFFPQFTGTITIVGVLLLLFRNYLPSPLREYVSESTDVLGSYGGDPETEHTQEDAEEVGIDETDEDVVIDEADEGEGHDEANEGERADGADGDVEPDSALDQSDASPLLNATSFTVLALVVYVIASYVIGILWTTPLFVLGYTSQFDLTKLERVGLAATSFAIAIVFMVILNVRLDEGLLWEILLGYL